MIELTLLSGFIFAALIVLLLPGPGVTYVVTRSLTLGINAGLISVVGLAIGALLHVIAAAIGLSALLLASSYVFSIIKILGACYLVYLGIRMLFQQESRQTSDSHQYTSSLRLLTDGILISLLNPKIALFFLAFLPQFVSPNKGSVITQVMILGMIYVGMALITDGLYVLLAGKIRLWIQRFENSASWFNRLGGGVFIGLGVTTALAKQP